MVLQRLPLLMALLVFLFVRGVLSQDPDPTGQPTGQPTDQPSSQPSGQPTGQPSMQPTMQPSSAPSAGSATGIWTVQVTQAVDDATFDPTTDENPCCASHWAFTSSTCTLRAAFAFCFTEVPWDTGPDTLLNVTACNIEFPTSDQTISLSSSPISLPSIFTERKNVSVHVVGDSTSITQTTNGQKVFSIIDSLYSTYPSSMDDRNYGVHVRFSDVTFRDVGDATSTSTAVSNTGIDGAAIYAVHLKSLYFDSCVFYRNRGRLGSGLYAENVTSVTLSSTDFVQNHAVSGGGSFLRNVAYVEVLDCNLTDNTASNIGGGMAFEACNNTRVSDSLFKSNTAGTHGGALSVHKSLESTETTGNTFNLNTASYGSAMFLRRANTWTFSGNAFTSNACLRLGGTVRWVRGSIANQDIMQEPQVDSGNTYSGNSYGTGSSESTGISTELLNVTVSPAYFSVNDYVDDAPLVANTLITDYYGSLIPDEDAAMSLTVRSELGHADGCSYNSERVETGFVGSTSGVSSGGSYTYDGFGALCIPGGYLTAAATASFSISDTNFPLYYEVGGADQAVYDATYRVVYGSMGISFRRCRMGEYFDFQDSSSRKKCLSCQNSYTVKNSSTNGIIQCEACPEMAQYCYSDNIVLRKGTWRYSYYTSTIFECPMYENCEGGEEFGNSSCLLGSTGPLCGVCSDGYVKASDGEHCYACADWSINPGAALIVPLCLLGVVIVSYLVYQTYRIRKHHRLINIVYPLGHGGAGNEHDPSRLELDDASSHAVMAGMVSGGNNLHHHDDLIHEERRSIVMEVGDTYHAAREALFELHDKLHVVQSELYEAMMKTSGKVKILFGTYQILVLLPTNFRLSEPHIGSAFKQFCNTFMFMHFDIMRALPLSCFRSWTYLDSMQAITSIPLVLSLVLIIGYILYVRFYAYVYKPSSLIPTTGLEAYFRRNDERVRALPEAEEAFEKEVMVMRQNMLSRFLFVAVICSYMSVPHVLLSAIKVFDCVDIDPLREVEAYSGASSSMQSTIFLRADLSIDCTSDEYESGKAYVIFMCILYPAIFGVIYTALYLRATHIAHMAHRHNSEENRLLNVSAAIRFLFLESYKPRLLIWELVDLSKRLLLCCSIYSMQPGTSLQTMAALLICLVFYKLQCYYRPYLKRNDNALSELGYVQLSCTIFVLFLFRNQTAGDYREADAAAWYTALDVLLVMGNCLLMALILYLTTLGSIKHFRLESTLNRAWREVKAMAMRAMNLQPHDEERPLDPNATGADGQKDGKNKGTVLEETASPLRANEADREGTGREAGVKEDVGDSIDAFKRRVLARSYINDIVGKVRRFRTFNKDEAQLRHKKLSQRRQLEYEAMRRDFQQLLHKLNTPGNDIVQVLMVSDESTLDELNEHKKLLEDALTDAENQLHDMQAYKKEVIIETGLPYDRLQNLGDATRFTRDDYRYFAEPLWLPPGASIDDNRLDRTWLRPAEQLDPRESRGLVGEHEFVDITQSAMANRGRGENSDQFKLSDSEDSEEDDDSDFEEQNLDGLVGNFPIEPATPAMQEMQGQDGQKSKRTGSVMFSVTSTSEDDEGADDSGWGSESMSSIEYGPVTEGHAEETSENDPPVAVFHLSDSSDEGEEKFGADSDLDMEFDMATTRRNKSITNMVNDGSGFMVSSTDLSDSDEEIEFDMGDLRQAESTNHHGGTFHVSDSEESD